MEPSTSNEIEGIYAEYVHYLETLDETCDRWEIPLAANAWVSDGTHEVITDNGLGNWMSTEAITHIYFYVKETVKLDLFVKCKVPDGESMVEVRVLDVPLIIDFTGPDYHCIPIGTFRIFGPGYVRVELRGIEKTGGYFADVCSLVIPKKSLAEDSISFIVDDEENTYWHRRGPSIHLVYEIPKECVQQEYYYNEVTVPAGCDCIGSYFMAIGFTGGYFGIQVNSTTERRVLFSVWSPQETDDPDEVTDDNAVLMINKGDDVVVKCFGNEGSGGQSYFSYDWLPDVTYKFLVRGRPDPVLEGYTLFSGWFGKKDSPDWKLIAEFSRPKMSEYLTHFHSFIENFLPEESSKCRVAYFNNQWVCDGGGNWFEVTTAKLTGDNTAESSARMDFEGGLKSDGETDGFYLKHCGFFVGACNLSEQFCRKPVCKAPCAPCDVAEEHK